MQKAKFRLATIILGSILALAIVFSQYLTPEQLCSSEKVKSEQTDKTGEERSTFVSLPSFSLPAPLSVQVNLDAYCLFEILFEENIDEFYSNDDASYYTDRFFATMFRVIISPNAP